MKLDILLTNVFVLFSLSSTNTSFDRLKAQFTAVRKVKKQSLIKRLRESNTALVPGNSDISIHLVESKVQAIYFYMHC